MARPFPVLSASSPILPGTALGNITDTLSIGNSSYNALWLTVNKRISHRLQFNGTYTWSKSIDWNSRNFEGVVVQDSTNPRGDRGLSDFDARHHFHISTLYDLPFKGNRIVEGWRLSTIVTLQSGNPLTIFAGDPAAGPAGSGIPAGAGISSFTGLANTRPDLVGTPPSVSATFEVYGSRWRSVPLPATKWLGEGCRKTGDRKGGKAEEAATAIATSISGRRISPTR